MDRLNNVWGWGGGWVHHVTVYSFGIFLLASQNVKFDHFLRSLHLKLVAGCVANMLIFLIRLVFGHLVQT